jgi:predicted transcriptional regulator
MKNYTSVKSKVLKNTQVRYAYDALGPEYDLIRQIIKKRTKRGLTQEALARKIGTKQSAISRLESGGANPSVAFLRSVSHALGGRLKISL